MTRTRGPWGRRDGLCAVLLLLPLVLGCASLQRARGASQAAQEAPSLSTCSCLVVSLASGHLGPDSPEQLWMADERSVHRVGTDGSLEELWTAPRFSRVLRLEAADLDGDGRSEWVVLLDTGRFRSHVLRWDGAAWQPSRPWAGFLRPVRDREGTLQLLGQGSGGARPFSGEIVEVSMDAEGALSGGSPVEAPPEVLLYDYFWLPGEQARLFVLEEDGGITERDPRSPAAVLWRSEERVVARPVEVEREVRDLLGDLREQHFRLAPPPRLVQLDQDPELELLLVTGPPRPKVAFENLRLAGGGDVRALDPAARGLVELHRTPLLGRFLSSVWAGAWEGREVWLAAVWTRDAGGFVRPESRVFLFDPSTGNLVPPKAAAP